MTNTDIISQFIPKLIDIKGMNQLRQAIRSPNLLVYGEIHGIQENADVIYTLAHDLGIKRIAIENSPSIKEFIDTASKGIYDFSLIDPDTFDSSILSLEVAKTLAALLTEGTIDEIIYIDTFFDNLDPSSLDHPDSPQRREQTLAENILRLDTSASRTLCLLGQWHTRTDPVQLDNHTTHKSALYRIRQAKENAPFVHMIYRQGQARNDGRILNLPERIDVSHDYEIRALSGLDFDIHVPQAHSTRLTEAF